MRAGELERALTRLGRRLDVTPAAGLPGAVARRLTETPRPRRVRIGMTPLRRRSLALGLAFLTLLLAGAAVASRLGVRGVRIVVTPSPAVSPSPGASPDLGFRVTLAQARASAGFTVLVPTFLSPDAVHLSGRPTIRVSLAYLPRPGLPEVAGTGLGALLTEFRARLDQAVLEKVIGPDRTRLVSVDVNGAPGLWIEGAPHTVGYLDESGQFFEDTIRLAGNVLLWQVGEVTLRLESALSLEESVRIAQSAR